MDDPDISVSLVKLNSSDQEDPKEVELSSNSSWIGSSKDCHLLWESLRKQGQLFKVLDTLTAKTARLIGRLQNQTATAEDGETVLELLSQLGIMFIDEETKEDGTKEKRYTFVTDAEVTLPRQPSLAKPKNDEPMQENAAVKPAGPRSGKEAGGESDDDQVEGFEPDTVDAAEDTADVDDAQPTTPPCICEWCKEDFSTPVMLDLHKLQYCKVLKKPRPRSRAMLCPKCGGHFGQVARFYNHLLTEHELETAEALKILHELEDRQPDKPPEKQKETEDSTSNKENDQSSKSPTVEIPPKAHMICEVCKDNFGTRIDLRTHLMEAHDFSRQKAVSSVYESSKAAQLWTPTKPDSDARKKPRKALDGLFTCKECETSYNDRRELVDHLMSEHDLPQAQAHKEANKQYKDMNATFACNLCPSKYSVRFALSKHFVGIHKLSAKQARAKSWELYPGRSKRKRQTVEKTTTPRSSTRSKKTSRDSNTVKSNSHDKDEGPDVVSSVEQSQHPPRSTQRRGMESSTPERTSKRLAKRRKGKKESSENEGDTQHDRKNTENEELNSEEDVTEKENGKDKESNISDGDKELEVDEDKDDEDYVPSESDSEVKKLRKGRSDRPQKNVRGRRSEEEETNENQDDADYVPSEIDKKLRKRRSDRPEKTVKRRRGRPPTDVKYKHECPHCGKTFNNLSYAKIHMTAVHKEKPEYQCSTCQKPFYFRNTFIRHLNCHRNEELGIRFPCEVCGKCFFDKYTLLAHSKIHSKDKPFECEYCKKTFFHQSLLKRHRNMHTKETEYKCDYCSRVFYRKAGLRYHLMSLHENKRDHVCKHCGQGFASKSAMLAHEHTHSTQRPFQCDICGQRVKTKGNLKEHMTCVHTNERNFKCDVCQKTFNRSHRLTLHMMMHRDERPHKCHLCDKAFRTRTNLRVHIKWHQDQRDFQCEQCGKTFLIPGNLDRHMQTHRNGKSSKRKSNKKEAPSEDSKLDLQNPDQSQVQVQVEAEVCPAVENQFQTVQNLVAGGGFESDLPTLASIAQHLSTMNIPVFQVPNTSSQGPIPVSIHPSENTCTPLPGSVMSGEASMALAAFSQVHAQQQLHGQSNSTPVVSQAMQGDYGQMELTM